MAHDEGSDGARTVPADEVDEREARAVRAFDIRTISAALLGIYGLVTLVMGLVAVTDEDLERAGGMNVNLVTGIVLVVVAAGFLLWVRLRPLVVPTRPHDDGDAQLHQ